MDTKADGWIKWEGGECPIPWAGPDDYKVRFYDDSRQSGARYQERATYWIWQNSRTRNPITHFRLTNGWIYVHGDGTIPEQIRGAKAWEWELRYRHGQTTISAHEPRWWQTGGKHNGNFHHANHRIDIVAVRLVKKMNGKCKINCGHGNCIFCLEKRKPLVGEYALKQIEIDKLLSEQPKLPLLETAKQRLTREDYLAYKAKHPDPVPFVPMRENEQYEIAAASLVEHDKYWPRKGN